MNNELTPEQKERLKKSFERILFETSKNFPNKEIFELLKATKRILPTSQFATIPPALEFLLECVDEREKEENEKSEKTRDEKPQVHSIIIEIKITGPED